jgi:hypothetical protein
MQEQIAQKTGDTSLIGEAKAIRASCNDNRFK